jgi:hypothetical protein
VPLVHHHHSYGTHFHRRDVAPGPSPVELRRVRVPARHGPRFWGDAGTTGICQCRQARRALVRRSTPRRSPALHLHPRTPSCASFLGLEPEVASRSPKPTTGGSTPSEPALRPATSRAISTLTTAEASSGPAPTGPVHGSVAPWGAAGCRPAVFRHRGFDSSPAHRCASRLTGRAPGPYPGRDWVRGPGRAPPAAVAQPGEAPARQAGGRGCKSRRWRHVDVAEWIKAPVYEAGGCRFDPCRRRASRRSSVEREHRFPKAGVARSSRAGEARAPGHARPTGRSGRRPDLCASGARPCPRSSAKEEHVPGTDEAVGAKPTEGPMWKGTGQMRSPPATRVRAASPCGCESRPFRPRK